MSIRKINYRPNPVTIVLDVTVHAAIGEALEPCADLAVLGTGPIPRRGEGRCRNISECFV